MKKKRAQEGYSGKNDLGNMISGVPEQSSCICLKKKSCVCYERRQELVTGMPCHDALTQI